MAANSWSPTAIAVVPGTTGKWIYSDGRERHPQNNVFTIYGPFDVRGQPHPAAVAADAKLKSVLAKAAAKARGTKKASPELTYELVEAIKAAHGDGTDSMIEGFARRWLKAAREGKV
jgi:hypothetical protein